MKLICPNCGETLDQHQKHGKRMCHVCGCNVREIWQKEDSRVKKYEESKKIKQKFIDEFGELCFPQSSTEKEKWKNLLNKAKTEIIPTDSTVSEYEAIISKYDSEIKYYTTLQSKEETYISLTQDELIKELDFYQDSDTCFYETNDGNIFYANSDFSYSIGKVNYYTKNDTIFPCFISNEIVPRKDNNNISSSNSNNKANYLDNYFDYMIRNSIASKPNNQNSNKFNYSKKYDHEPIIIKVPCCAKRKSKPNGFEKEICGIKQFSSNENKVPFPLTVSGHRQKLKELQKQQERQKRQESMRSLGTFLGSILISALIATIGLLLIALIGAIIGAIADEEIGLEPGFINAFIGMINGELAEHVYVSDGIVRMVFGLKYGGMVGCIIASIIAIGKNLKTKDDFWSVAFPSASGLLAGIAAGIVLATIVGIFARWDGWNGTTDYKTKIGAIIGGVIAGITAGAIDDDGEVTGAALFSSLVILGFCLLAALSIRIDI